ncbi:MAG: M23 family metallopeptidase, partial [Oscillospiraceae bacterium]|nr:M23 family metallopeptidase [Oscillospiraceae bacterium]
AAVTTEAVPQETTEKVTETFIPQAMVRPLNGEILNEFSDGELVKSKTLNVWKTHDGVDIAGAAEEKVKSMTSGTVTKVYDDQMLGSCVIVDHGGGLEGYYCNLSKDIPVAEGQSVSAGTIIGSVGNTAEGEISEDSHLHFAVKKNGDWIDPIALISGEGS